MSVERILDIVGSNGQYQFRLYGFIFFTTFMCGINYYTQVFIFAAPPHDCSTLLERVNMTMDGDYYDKENADGGVADGGPTRTRTIVYDYTSLFPTLTSDHHWVCEDDKNPTIAHQLFWSGNIVGYLMWGYTNDNFGRRPTVLLSTLAYFFGGLLTLFSPYFWLIGISRFVVGMAHHTISHLPYLIAVEYCGVRTRTYPLLAVMVSYTFASLAIPLLAKILPAWRSLKMIAVFPNLLVIGAYILGWIPESLSWLICKNKIQRAKETLVSVAKVNGINIEGNDAELQNLLDGLSKRELEESAEQNRVNETSGIIASVRNFFARCSNKFLLRIILAFANTFVGFVAYYGHASNTSNLGSNMHLSFVFAALVEIPAFSIPFIVNYAGRRWTLFTCFLASGAMSIFYVSTPSDLSHVALTLALLGRMFATGAYYICLQYSSEIFPTSIRGSGMSACEIVGGIGLFISPWIVYLAKFQVQLPLLIFGGLSVFGATVTLFLPETCDENLPNTIEDANEFGKDQSFGYCILCSNSAKKSAQIELTDQVDDPLLIARRSPAVANNNRERPKSIDLSNILI